MVGLGRIGDGIQYGYCGDHDQYCIHLCTGDKRILYRDPRWCYTDHGFLNGLYGQMEPAFAGYDPGGMDAFPIWNRKGGRFRPNH